ncbi:MAG TPA: hypothetical protein P5027_08420 [Flavobacteriales bacterium]|nr:hypothetical protein [Flavobacteriales bacterium]
MRALLLPLLLGSTLAQAQGPKEWYWTSGGEWIFSMATLDVNGNDNGNILRFSPFFNVQGMANYDFNDHVGLFAGLSIRNVGFIYELPEVGEGVQYDKYKFRTYNAGIPVGFKFGEMHRAMVFLGYEFELPFNYKEKRYLNEVKEDKFNVWFSDRTEPFFHALFLGFQFKYGTTLKFKYYLTNFHNTDYTETVDGVQVKPYDGLNANILYVSLGFGLFRNDELIYKDRQRPAPPAEPRAWRL